MHRCGDRKGPDWYLDVPEEFEVRDHQAENHDRQAGDEAGLSKEFA